MVSRGFLCQLSLLLTFLANMMLVLIIQAPVFLPPQTKSEKGGCESSSAGPRGSEPLSCRVGGSLLLLKHFRAWEA